MFGSAVRRTAPANSELVEVAQHARENFRAVRAIADIHMEAPDVDAFAYFGSCGQNIRPVSRIDRGRAENFNFVFVFQQGRVLPGERLGSTDDALMTTLNDDGDFAHNSSLMAFRNRASILAFVKCRA